MSTGILKVHKGQNSVVLVSFVLSYFVIILTCYVVYHVFVMV